MGHLTFVGHSTVLLELGGARLLTDPVLRRRILHIRRQVPPPPAQVAERLDAILVSHLHHDHLDLPSLRRAGQGVRILAPRGAGELLQRRGFERVTELSPGEATRVGGVEVAAVPARHPGRRRPFGGPTAQPIGFDVRGSHRVYFAGDTEEFPEMADLAGVLDVALLPVWGWGVQLPPGSGHLDPVAAARVVALLRPRLAVPIHWGTLFQIGLAGRHRHLLRDPPHQFAARVAELAPDVDVAVLQPGDSLALTA